MKKITSILVGLFILIASITSALAFNGNGFGDNEAIRQAVEDNDFSAWKQAHEDMLTEDNFNNAVEGFQRRGHMRENMEAGRTAIEAGDYDAWLEVSENCPNAEEVTEDNFDKFVEMHNAIYDGDIETAQEIAQENGFTVPLRNGQRDGMGMRKAHFGNMRNAE